MTTHSRRAGRLATAITIALVLAGVAQATVWNPAAEWQSENYNNPLNSRWSFMGSTLDSGGALIVMANNIYATGKRGWTISCNEGHGWGEQYWSPRFIRNFGASDTVYTEREWTFESDWSTTVPVYAPVGTIVVGGNASYISQNSAAMRWTAPSNGLYQVTLSFAGATTSGTSANVALKLDGASQWTETISAYQQKKSYTHKFNLTTGQKLDAVVMGKDFVTMDYSITDTVSRKGGTVFCLK